MKHEKSHKTKAAAKRAGFDTKGFVNDPVLAKIVDRIIEG